ncbi:MAG: DUF1080 domain-containing protein [Armatimonadetes bacterium]|nr:DUF1080 domain-containing protein [Armatimonadota bacterium]
MIASLVASFALGSVGSAPGTIAPLSLTVPASQAAQRPRDIWVFRSVLDQNARMATAMLHKNLTVAYDATACGLYQVWTGGVKFDGAVYTTVHGPQPTSVGKPYVKNDVSKTTWFVKKGTGAYAPISLTYGGYTIKQNQVTFEWKVPLGGGKFASVFETPEYAPTDPILGDLVGLSRTFVPVGLPKDWTLQSRMSFVAMPDVISGEKDRTRGGSGLATYEIDVVAGQSTSVNMFWKRQGESNSGVVFSPMEDNPQPKPVPQQDTASERVPGLSLRLYWIGGPFDKLPRLVPGQTPNYSVVVPQLNLGNDGFGAFTDHFFVQVTGFIVAPEDGEYEFSLGSDDGSKLVINGTTVIDNDGLHGESPVKTGKIKLNKGENKIAIDYFENEGDAALRLRWRKGSSSFELVPASAFTTPAGEVRVTAPGKKQIFGQQRTRPGDKSPLEAVHPSFKLETVRPDSFQPRVGGMDFAPNGDLLVCTWDPDGAVYRLSGIHGPREQIKVTRIAAGLAEPLGLKVVNGRTYVLQKQELTELVDNNGDGITDTYRCVANGWGVTSNFHEFAFGLEYRNGKFYGNLATAINPGGASTSPQNPDRGRTVEIDAKTGTYRFIVSGLRTPNGIGVGSLGDLYISDNQGDWLPSSKIMLVREGAFYGNRSVDPVGTKNKKEDPPVVWLPQNEIGNSPSGIIPLTMGPYKGQMAHGDVTHGGLKRVFVERIDGVTQGVVFRWTQGLEAGINRVLLSPKGEIYVGGIGSSGNWGQTGKASYGLQRLTYNGASTFEMLSVQVKSNGLQVNFTEPLGTEQGELPLDYSVSHWRYVPTVEYGGPKVDEAALTVKSVSVSKDRKSAFLEVPGLKEGTVVYLRCHPSMRSGDGEVLWSTEAWYTLNKLPKAEGKVAPTRSRLSGVMTPTEFRDGFKPLFDGTNLSNFMGFRQNVVPSGWGIEGGDLVFTPGKQGGDLRTKEMYADFDLRFLWKVTPGGNSGVIYRSSEDRGNSWETGPEYQVLDNASHEGIITPSQASGSLYDLVAAEYDYTRPVGEWNEGRIVISKGILEHYLNGVRLVRIDMNPTQFWDLIKASKFRDMAGFARNKEGYIVFQDHGNKVMYRNIRVKRL